MSLLLHPSKLGMLARLLLTCFVLLLFSYASFADFTGSVVSVLDGDTNELLHYRQPLRPSLRAALSVKIQGIPLAA